jgi:hypothetical protein
MSKNKEKTKDYSNHKNLVSFDFDNNLDRKSKSFDKNNFAKENTINQANDHANNQLQHRLKIRSMLLNNVDNGNQKETNKNIVWNGKKLANDI